MATMAPTARPRQLKGSPIAAAGSTSRRTTRVSDARSALANTSALWRTQSPTAWPDRSRLGVRPFVAIVRIRPPSSMARTSQPDAGTHSDTRAASVSATRSGSRLAFTARTMSAKTSARASVRRSGVCNGRSLAARSVRSAGRPFLLDRRRARVCRPVPVNRLWVPLGMADPSSAQGSIPPTRRPRSHCSCRAPDGRLVPRRALENSSRAEGVGQATGAPKCF